MSKTVQNVIDRVSQDVRAQLSSTDNTLGQQTTLIDYTNRIHLQMLRFSRWAFLRAEPQYFMTVFGQTDFWIGSNGSSPNGMVNTGLNLTDVDYIEKDSVRDISNNRILKSFGSQPIGSALNFRSGQTRPQPPRTFWQDHNDVNILHIYPGADQANPFQPVPSPPALSSSVGGALAQRTYFVRLTFTDTNGGESTGSIVSASYVVPASQVLVVQTPVLAFTKTWNGVTYNGYNVYISTSEGTETLQNNSPIALGTNWTEPTSGLVVGRALPTVNTLQQMGSYLIQFRYYKARKQLSATSDTIQIPDEYFDILIDGVSALTWKLLNQAEQASASNEKFKAGLTSMIWDKNLFPDTDFISPDPSSYVNSQLLGILPDNL